jgi:hypothetical protein
MELDLWKHILIYNTDSAVKRSCDLPYDWLNVNSYNKDELRNFRGSGLEEILIDIT